MHKTAPKSIKYVMCGVRFHQKLACGNYYYYYSYSYSYYYYNVTWGNYFYYNMT